MSDSSIREFAEAEGWRYFQVATQIDDRPIDATTWPLIRVGIDEGGDGLSAIMYLIYALGCCVELCQDASNHGLHNDCNLTVKDLGLSVEDSLFAAACNITHSPYNTGARLEESVDALKEWYAIHDEHCVLLTWSLGTILAERGESHRIGEPAIAKELWEEMRWNKKLQQRQTIVRGGRFCQTVHRAREFCPEWTINKLRWQVYALATHQLDRNKLDDIVARQAALTLTRVADGVCPGLRSQTKRDEAALNTITSNHLQKTYTCWRTTTLRCFKTQRYV